MMGSVFVMMIDEIWDEDDDGEEVLREARGKKARELARKGGRVGTRWEPPRELVAPAV